MSESDRTTHRRASSSSASSARSHARSSASGSGGGSNPPPDRGPQNPGLGDDIEVEERQKTQVPKRYKVLLHNDDYTTMEFVVEVLRRYFHKSETEAVHIMLTVHRKGSAVAGVYPRDVAETKAAEVMRHAREYGHPLLLTTEAE